MFFKQAVINNLIINNTYSVSIKLRYNISNFVMVGGNFGFIYNDLYSIFDLIDNCNIRLEDSLTIYDINSESITYIQLTFSKIDNVLLKEYSLDINNESLNKTITKDLNIPFSTNQVSLGSPLVMTLDEKGLAVKVLFKNKKKITNLITLIKDNNKFVSSSKNIPKDFDSTYKFYYLNYEIPYILVLKQINENTWEKIRFSLSGTYINSVLDTYKGDLLTRKVGNKEILIKDNNIIKVNQVLNTEEKVFWKIYLFKW